MWHGPDALDAAPLEFMYAALGMVSPGRTECSSRNMVNVECGAFHGGVLAAACCASGDAACPPTTSPDRANGGETFGGTAVEAIGARNCAAASGVSGPWLEEAKLWVESPGINET